MDGQTALYDVEAESYAELLERLAPFMDIPSAMG